MIRDPRINPRPGDVVTPTIGGGRVRHVTLTWSQVYYWYFTATGLHGPDRNCSYRTWREWCRKTKAVAVKVG